MVNKLEKMSKNDQLHSLYCSKSIGPASECYVCNKNDKNDILEQWIKISKKKIFNQRTYRSCKKR